MSCTFFRKPGDANEHLHFLSPPPEVSGGIATPERSKAERDVPRASSGHCTAYSVLGSGSGTETQAESLLENNHFLVLNAVPNVAALREQVRFYFGWDPKKQRQHIFDVVAVLTTGERIAFAIKPEFRLNSSNQEKQDFEDEMRVVAWRSFSRCLP